MHEERLPELLSACFSALDLQTISRMCACSKAMREQLLGLVRTDDARLLLQTTQEAAQAHARAQQLSWSRDPGKKAARAECQRACSALYWLLRHAPAAAAALDVPALLRIPDMNHELAQVLLGAGVRVSYAQLVAAARERVRGVEVWVAALRAFPELMAESGVPEVLQALFCQDSLGRVEDPIISAFNPSPDDPGLPDLLHLAVNCEPNTIYYFDTIRPFILRLLSDQLLGAQPQLVLELLHTAVQLRAVEVEQRLLQAPAARSMQLMDLVQLLKVGLRSNLVGSLLQLPAAAQLQADEHVGQLLLQVARDSRTYSYAVDQLCRHPAAANISTQMVVTLLRASASTPPTVACGICPRLCRLPAAAAISSATMAELLVAAVGSQCLVNELCELPSAKQLSSDVIVRAFQARIALEGGEAHWHGTAMAPVGRLPAAAGVSAAALEQLLLTAAERRKCDTAAVLLGMPGTRQLSADAVASVMEAALVTRHTSLLTQASALPGAAELSGAATGRLLQAAASAGNLSAVREYCYLPGASSAPADALKEALKAALAALAENEHFYLRTGHAEILVPLMQLPGAAGISVAGFAEVARAAMTGGGSQELALKHLQALFTLPAAAAMTTSEVQQLVCAAIDQGQCSCMALLSGLPAAAALSQEACTALLQHAVDTGYSEYVNGLRGLPAPGEETLARLLQAAAQQRNWRMLRALLKLSGASAAAARAFSTDAAVQLLADAVDSSTAADVQLVCQQLPAAASIPGARVLRLLKTAFHGAEPAKLVQGLCNLPGMASISAADVPELAAALSSAVSTDAAVIGITKQLRARLSAAAAAALPAIPRRDGRAVAAGAQAQHSRKK